MKSSFKNFNRWLAAFGVAAFLMVAGWQMGSVNAGEVYTETEIVIAGSGGERTKRCIYDADNGGMNIDCKKSGSLCKWDSHCLE